MKLLKIYLLLFLSSVVSASPNDSLFQQANKDYQKQAYQQHYKITNLLIVLFTLMHYITILVIAIIFLETSLEVS